MQLSSKWIARSGIALTFATFLAAALGSAQTAQAQDPTFTLNRDTPALSRGGGGSWDSAYLDPGTVLFHDDMFHMFYVAIPKWPHPLAIGYASSQDGVSWTRQADGPILTHDQAGDIDATSIMSTSAMVTADGTWVLYFTSVGAGESFYGTVARATAPGPLGPWSVDPEPVLTPGPEGAWDGIAVGDASVVQTPDGYAMYYAGFGNFQNGAFTEKRSNIGMATSVDGITWTKFDNPETTDPVYAASDPVLPASADESAWDSFRVVDPNVQVTPDGWVMAYRGATFGSSLAVGLATSQDGVTWQRPTDQPLMTDRDVGNKIFFVTLLSRPAQDYLYLELGTINQTAAYLATRPRMSN